jgi:hypothetical protein
MLARLPAGCAFRSRSSRSNALMYLTGVPWRPSTQVLGAVYYDSFGTPGDRMLTSLPPLPGVD